MQVNAGDASADVRGFLSENSGGRRPTSSHFADRGLPLYFGYIMMCKIIDSIVNSIQALPHIHHHKRSPFPSALSYSLLPIFPEFAPMTTVRNNQFSLNIKRISPSHIAAVFWRTLSMSYVIYFVLADSYLCWIRAFSFRRSGYSIVIYRSLGTIEQGKQTVEKFRQVEK